MFVFWNPSARAKLHQQKRALKLCSATLSKCLEVGTDMPRSCYLLRLYGTRRHKGSSEFCFPKTHNVPRGDHWVLSEDKTHSLPWGRWSSVYLPTKKIEQNACKLFPWLRLRHKFCLGFKELYSGSRTSRMFKLWFPLGVCEFCSPWWVSEWVWFLSGTQIFSLSNARVMLINSPYTKNAFVSISMCRKSVPIGSS